MEQIGVRELRQQASRYLERVKAGESIEVTERGTPVAVLVPAVRDETRERLIRQGRLARGAGPRVLPQPVEAAGVSTDELLEELRAERS